MNNFNISQKFFLYIKNLLSINYQLRLDMKSLVTICCEQRLIWNLLWIIIE